MREIFEDLKVIIVGAGISGLAAALTLYENGIENILILEAQPEPGGRIKSVGLDNGYVELGAQWLHGTKSELYKLAKENNLISPVTSYEGLGNFYCDNGKIVPEKIVFDVNNEIAQILSDLETSYSCDMPDSVGEYMKLKFEKYLELCSSLEEKQIKKDLFDWHLRFQMIDNGCIDLTNLSSQAFGEFEFCGGEDYVNLKGGYRSLIDLLVSKLPNGCLLTNCPVKTINWKETVDFTTENICEIVLENGDEFHADHIIVTCSVGYLKKNRSLFCPHLPLEYIKNLNCIGFDTVNKIYLEYDFNWWGDLKGIQFVWNSNDRKQKLKDSAELWTCDISGFDAIVDMPNILVGWVGGEGAVMMESLSTEEIKHHCTCLFRQITANRDIPEPINCIHSLWYSNKYVLGGYSHITVEREHYKMALSTLLKPIYSSLPDNTMHPTIMFAGEALHPKYYSTTHGAYESGKSQALRLLNYIESN